MTFLTDISENIKADFTDDRKCFTCELVNHTSLLIDRHDIGCDLGFNSFVQGNVCLKACSCTYFILQQKMSIKDSPILKHNPTSYSNKILTRKDVSQVH